MVCSASRQSGLPSQVSKPANSQAETLNNLPEIGIESQLSLIGITISDSSCSSAAAYIPGLFTDARMLALASVLILLSTASAAAPTGNLDTGYFRRHLQLVPPGNLSTE